MGWSGKDTATIIELTKQWNKLAEECGYIFSDDDRSMPAHLRILLSGIDEARLYQLENPPETEDRLTNITIERPKFETRNGESFLIGGDIIFFNGMKIGEVNPVNNHSIGITGTNGPSGFTGYGDSPNASTGSLSGETAPKPAYKQILEHIEKHLADNPEVRFTQSLFSLDINQFADQKHPELLNNMLRDNYNDGNEDILKRISNRLTTMRIINKTIKNSEE